MPLIPAVKNRKTSASKLAEGMSMASKKLPEIMSEAHVYKMLLHQYLQESKVWNCIKKKKKKKNTDPDDFESRSGLEELGCEKVLVRP